MKTKSKYFIIFSFIFICTISLFYISNLPNKQIVYKNSIEDENKILDKENNLNINNKEVNKTKSELKVLFVGDIMTDRYIRKQINKYENSSKLGVGEDFVRKYLNNLSEINSKYDYLVANLEGPITENKSVSLNEDGSYGKDLIFTFPTSTAKILELLNIKVVSLANNHTDNFYHKGYKDTKRFLEKENVNYFGNPYNNFEKESLSEILCEKDICTAYVGYNQFTTNNSPDIISKEIKRIKEINLEIEKTKIESRNKFVDFIVVMPHWGTEYEKLSNQMQKDYAHNWIDSGADVVVGAHPHVTQESEIYKNKYIYYSLGNYIFDQWFTKDVQNGLGLDITFKKECESAILSLSENKIENKIESCKKEITLNKELRVFIDRNGVKYDVY